MAVVSIANVANYGAVGNGASDDTSAIQRAAGQLVSGGELYFPSGLFRVAGTVTVPAGVTATSSGGATIKPTGQGKFATGGDGVTIRKLTFNFTSDANLLGGERAFSVANGRFLVDRCRFIGNGYRYGIYINHPSGGACNDGEVTDCRFETTSYAVFKQGNNGTSAKNLKILRNKFSNIQHGDAIQLNVGTDTGYVIARNEIDGVSANGVANAGMGIGVAGGSYGGAATAQTRHFLIESNLIKNVDRAAIHVEACNAYTIRGNRLLQEAGRVDVGAGVEVYGSPNAVVEGNDATDFGYGIYHAPGFIGGAYVVSADQVLIRLNRARSCQNAGIYDGTTGQNKRAAIEQNTLESCPVGIYHHGGAIVRIRRNEFQACTAPLQLDMNPASKAAINATTTRHLEVIGNRAYTSAGAAQSSGNVLTNIIADSLVDEDNTFTIA